MIRRRTTLYLAALLLLSIGAFSAANAATNISSCTVIGLAGNYTVTANLTAKGNCIEIMASNVSIDLQGHMITGSGGGSGIFVNFGIFLRQNIIIANGTIKDFSTGISLFNARYVTISNINATQNMDFGIFLDDFSTVDNSQANNNGGDGIHFFGVNNTVNNSPANNNGGAGILFGNGNSAVSNSPANNNGGAGIESDSGGNNTVTNSPANNNMGGILFTGDNNTIINSPANGNTAFGIDITGDNNSISDSPANGNKGDGIDIAGFGNLLTRDTANGNVGTGITLTCASNLFGNTAQGNGTNTSFSGGSCVLLDNKF